MEQTGPVGTQERSVVSPSSSPLKPSRPTINPKSRDESSTFVLPHVGEVREVSEIIDLLYPFASTDPAWTQIADFTLPAGDSLTSHLNHISEQVFQSGSLKEKIQFIEAKRKTTSVHPTGTICRPNVVAIKASTSYNKVKPHWSTFEATGGIKSEREAASDSMAQAGGYLMFHLQARPDRVTTAGIWAQQDKNNNNRMTEFAIFWASASRVYHTKPIPFNDRAAHQLMYAFVWNTYHPTLDASVEIDLKQDIPTFTIAGAYTGLEILRAGGAIGRRTMILAADSSSLVIKEQYIECNRRLLEGPLLEKIHERFDFPGVVRYEKLEGIKSNGKDVLTYVLEPERGKSMLKHRIKTRLIMTDKGSPFDSIKTFQEMLQVAYDVLEVIRVLHAKRNVLHRDLSANNILVHDEPHLYEPPADHDLGDMCFSSHLLGLLALQDGEPSSPAPNRYETRLMLSDWDSGEDTSTEVEGKQPAQRTGTPRYMAIIVRNKNHTYTSGFYPRPPMPQVDARVEESYKTVYPNRANTFAPSQEIPFKWLPVAPGQNVEPYKHLLQYDVESVFWCMMAWSIYANPENEPMEPIPAMGWLVLTSHDDGRFDYFLYRAPDKQYPLHPTYLPASLLLQHMAQHLLLDPSFSENNLAKDRPEYLCEVFQRLVLNFLVEKRHERFMREPKSNKAREKEKEGFGGATESKSLTSKFNTSNTGTGSSQSGLGTSGSGLGTKRPRQQSNVQTNGSGDDVSGLNESARPLLTVTSKTGPMSACCGLFGC